MMLHFAPYNNISCPNGNDYNGYEYMIVLLCEITPLQHAIKNENSEIIMLVLFQSKFDVFASSIIRVEMNSNEKYHLFSEEEESIEVKFNKKVEITPLHYMM